MTDKEALFEYTLRLGDTGLVLGHRLSEWCGHGPILEEDIALTNIALDLVGQARNILAYAGTVEGKGRTADDLAYLRDERDFRNLLLTEHPNGDFACTMMRQFLMSAYQFYLFESLKKSADAEIAAFAEKSFKETTYHLRHSTDWLYRLGDGTEESHQRLQDAVDDLWIFTGDLFEADEVDIQLMKKNIAADHTVIKEKWNKTVEEVFAKSKLTKPEMNSFMRSGSRKGLHTEALGHLLADMQFIPRAYPGAKW